MFLVGKQKSRFEEYESLTGKAKAMFTFRLIEKIKMFLNDITEVNQVLGKLSPSARQRAFTDKNVQDLFDLLETAIISMGVMPIIQEPDGSSWVYGEFQALSGKHNVEGIYKFTRLATDEEIARFESISTQIKRLEEILKEPRKHPNDLTVNEFRTALEDMK